LRIKKDAHETTGLIPKDPVADGLNLCIGKRKPVDSLLFFAPEGAAQEFADRGKPLGSRQQSEAFFLKGEAYRSRS